MIRSCTALSLAAALLAPSLAMAASAPMPPAETAALARDILGQLIAVRSTHDVGTAAVAEAIAARLRAGGFGNDDIHVLADPKFPNQVNVVVRLKGAGKGRPVMWTGHEDVVEAKPEDWSLPPFQLTEKDGYFYGRGSLDMKGADASMIASMIRLRAEGFLPDRDIIAAFTADEEVGLEQDGLAYLLRDHRDLVDADMALNPDTVSGQLESGRRARFTVETSQKVYATYQLEVTNPGGHSSKPRPDNAIYELAQGLVRLARFQFPYRTNATTRLELAQIATSQSGRTRQDLLAFARSRPDPRAAARLGRNLEFNPILHTTCVATMLAAGVQENALAARAQATVQCRLMPDETAEQTRLTLARVVADPRIAVSLTAPVVAGPESPPTPRVMGDIEWVVQSMWPKVPVMPVLEAGASDALYSRSAGIPSYGLSGIWNEVLDDRSHGRDERIGVTAFHQDVEFTYRLMKRLSQAK